MHQFRLLDVTDLGLFMEAWWTMTGWSLRIRRGLPTDSLYNPAVVLSNSTPEGSDDSQHLIVNQLEIAVLRSERYHFAGQNCLLRSLTLNGLLRKRGLTSVINIGVLETEQGDVRGHAWVTLNGRVLGDQPGSVNRYVVLSDQPDIEAAFKRLGVAAG